MSTGARRPGLGRWSWLTLSLVVVIAAAAAGVAKLAGAPDWLVVAALAVGAAVPLAAAQIRSQVELHTRSEAQQRKLVAGAAKPGRLVRDYAPAELRVHAAIRQDVPYVVRDVEPEIVSRLKWERRVLIVGPSMAGKTRLALSAAKSALGDFTLYVPVDGKSIHDELAAGTQFLNVAVWLDDLERYVGAGGLSAADLTTLFESGPVAVVATIRASEYEKLLPRGDIKPPGWEVPGWFGDPVWVMGWSDAELIRVGDTRAGVTVLTDARKYGLSNYLGGAPLVRQQLDIGATEHPEGFAVVRAASDWRRAGMEIPISRSHLVEVLPAYLPRKHTMSVDDQTNTGLSWALQRLNHTVALVLEEPGGFVALDLVLDLNTEAATAVPDQLWSTAIQHALPDLLGQIGYRAYKTGNQFMAITAWQKAAYRGDTAAMFGLGVLRDEADPPDLDGARDWWRKAADRGFPPAMVSLGMLLREADPPDLDGARAWYAKAAQAGHPGAMNNLATLLKEDDPPDLDGARAWWQKAADAGHAGAMVRLGLLLEEADPPDLVGARTWYTKAADAGDTDAMTNLGVMMGKSDPPDLDGAHAWWQKAANAGNGAAMTNLGMLLKEADPPDLDGAHAWWQKAAEAGDGAAMFILGVLLKEADPPDLDGAHAWWQKAANAGNGAAMFILGVLLKEADPPDLDGARTWWRKAAETGDRDAMNNLGMLLKEADPPDLDGARTWWQKAADAGNLEAMVSLGQLLRHADPPDLDGARTWCIKAAEAGDFRAMNNLAVLLTEADPPDLDGARTWYAKAANGGLTGAMNNLGLLLSEADPPDLAGALDWWRKAAAADNTEAMMNLAWFWMQVHPPDLDGALGWLRKAADAGHAEALQLLRALPASPND